MSKEIIYTKSFVAPEIDRREVLRYAGVREATPEIEKLLDECIEQAEKILSYKVCYGIFDISVEEDWVKLGFSEVKSKSLSKTLSGCEGAIIFCATIGAGVDRLIAKYNLSSPARAVLTQALGSERVEALCDSFCNQIECDINKECTRRFSPGYGDLPLSLQKNIFISLDPSKMIGVSLGENLFMTPTKSVTAIIGIKM